jgi:capsule biosynthesis phosphatase
MSYNKRIVCDIDDTILFTTNRDWANASPNNALIDKLNALHDSGWEIHFYTARGSLSCNGDRELADWTYRPGIEEYFKKHNIKYDVLSFEKPLASYYIDDKAITPEDFIDLDIEVLHGGLSGAQIERRGNKVYKTHVNSLESAQWYKEADDIVQSVKVHSVIGNTICLDYIEATDQPKIEQIDFIINKFKSVPSHISFDTYASRVVDHLKLRTDNNKYADDIIVLMHKYKPYYEQNKSFCHGDMSLDNMINRHGVLYLIDPNRPTNLYSSWLLDVSKVLHSSRRFDKPHIYDYFINAYKDHAKELKLLEATHWVRMIKYEKPENVKHIEDIIMSILQEIKVL